MGRVRPLKGCYRAGTPKVYPKVTAREIAKSDDFILACAELEAEPSVRLARDYRRRLGRFQNYKPKEKAG